MDILVLSDTHGRADRVIEVMRRTRAATVLFLGDGLRDMNVLHEGVLLRAVRGNCDFIGADIPETRVEIFGTYRVFMTHGHRFGVKYGEGDAIAAAVAADADVLLYGHTHCPVIRYLPAGEQIGDTVLKKPLTVFCPGSLGEPHGGKPTFGTLTVCNSGVLAAHGEL